MRTLIDLAILTAVAGTAPAPLAAQDHDFNISTRSPTGRSGAAATSE